jgi:hypothetical protein
MNEIKIKIKPEEERQFLFRIRDAVGELGYRILDFTNFKDNTYLITRWDSVYGKVEFIHLANDRVEVRIAVVNNSLYNRLLNLLRGAKTSLKN